MYITHKHKLIQTLSLVIRPTRLAISLMLTLHGKSHRRANVLASQPFFTHKGKFLTQNSKLLHKTIAGKLTQQIATTYRHVLSQAQQEKVNKKWNRQQFG